MKLNELIENPDNPSFATDEEMKHLEGKLERVPLGLTAMRIAYVVDQTTGKKVVLSGNKRLRCLKSKFGKDGDVPDEWFQDITAMSPAERHEFIVTANISDGHFDPEKLLEDYDLGQLSALMDPITLEKTFGKDLDISKLLDPKEQQTANASNDTEVGCSYLLGNNVLIAYDIKTADQIRQLYAQCVLSTDVDYKEATPKV